MHCNVFTLFLHLPAAPAVVHEYLITVELNISNSDHLNLLRIRLRNMTDHISINPLVQISDINITTGKDERGTHTRHQAAPEEDVDLLSVSGCERAASRNR